MLTARSFRTDRSRRDMSRYMSRYLAAFT
eukprot:COSAG02_NODE_25471_length_658_cov_0.579606_1_plen_28_part_10